MHGASADGRGFAVGGGVAHAVAEYIKENYPDKTLIISAHRMSSVADCDEILYLQDGRITERGTFDELIKLNGHFAAIWHSQQAMQKDIVDENVKIGAEDHG